MNEQSAKRIQLLLRESKKQGILPTILKQMNHLTGLSLTPNDILSLKESD